MQNTTLDKNKVEITRGDTRYHFVYPEKITAREAMELQAERGFHPAGYSFEGFYTENGKSYWKCWTSCD